LATIILRKTVVIILTLLFTIIGAFLLHEIYEEYGKIVLIDPVLQEDGDEIGLVLFAFIATILGIFSLLFHSLNPKNVIGKILYSLNFTYGIILALGGSIYFVLMFSNAFRHDYTIGLFFSLLAFLFIFALMIVNGILILRQYIPKKNKSCQHRL